MSSGRERVLRQSGAMRCAYCALRLMVPTAATRLIYRARRMPRHTCSVIFELNRTIDGLLRHRLHDRGAETPPIRRPYRRALALNPVHLEETIGKPTDVDVAGIR